MSNARFGLRVRNGLVKGITEGLSGFPLLLDFYTNASAAYSLRLLTSSYTGPAIRVRRSSDNIEQNIGFVNGVLDTASLLSFVGAGNGFITIWYDQSGNFNHAIQTTFNLQPQIISSGVLTTINSKPALSFNNSLLQRLSLNFSIWTYTGNSTVFHVSRNRNTSGNIYGSIISQGGGTLNGGLGIQWQVFPNSSTQACTDVYAPGGVSTTTTQSANTQYLAVFRWQNWSTHKTNGNTIIAINGTNQTTTTYGANPSLLGTSQAFIGAFDALSAGHYLGDIQEIIVYNRSFIQTEIDISELNINQYYNIY